MKKLLLTLTLILALASSANAQLTNALNDGRVISPYWQADADSYTFIGVSHPSLTGSASQIGVRVTALASGGGVAISSGPAAGVIDFTVSFGQVQRVFIVSTNHATLSTTYFPTGNFISASTNASYGTVSMSPKASNPTVQAPGTSGLNGNGIRILSMLNVWGAVIMPSSNAGFAMEFTGDIHTSTP